MTMTLEIISQLPTEKRGFLSFSVIWFGQTISLTGSGLTAFGLGIWVYQRSGQVTSFALTQFFFVLPLLLLSPLAGALVDRWDYRRVMAISDSGAALSSLAIALLLAMGHLQIWHIYLAVAINAGFSAFQQPAYTALTTLLIPKTQLGRTSGMIQAGLALSDILAPALAGFLVLVIGLSGVILIDFATFIFAVLALMAVPIPAREAAPEGKHLRQWHPIALLRESGDGWKFIATRPGLVGLLVFFAIANFASGVISALLVPMLLTFTTADIVGAVISTAGGGMLAGSLVLSVWGGPVRRVKGLLGFEFLKGLGILFMGLQPLAWLVAAAASTAHFSIPIVNGLNQAIWQTGTPQELQGRVFALRQMLARAMVPLAFLLAGPLADRVFEPLMAHPQGLSRALEGTIGFGPGRGMGLTFILMGGTIMLACVSGMLYPPIRNVENEQTLK
jgi:DHA3 family macrolide efflux protein-like MFS transporter